MKKILTKILLGFLCVVIIAVSGLCAYLFGNEKPGEVKRPTVTDASGNVYLAVVGENGETTSLVAPQMLGRRWIGYETTVRLDLSGYKTCVLRMVKCRL